MAKNLFSIHENDLPDIKPNYKEEAEKLFKGSLRKKFHQSLYEGRSYA